MNYEAKALHRDWRMIGNQYTKDLFSGLFGGIRDVSKGLEKRAHARFYKIERKAERRLLEFREKYLNASSDARYDLRSDKFTISYIDEKLENVKESLRENKRDWLKKYNERKIEKGMNQIIDKLDFDNSEKIRETIGELSGMVENLSKESDLNLKSKVS